MRCAPWGRGRASRLAGYRRAKLACPPASGLRRWPYARSLASRAKRFVALYRLSVSVLETIGEASRTGKALRVHTQDGEVLVARVLSYDELELVYAVETSSRPERYAVCDSTGFKLALAHVERVTLLEKPRLRVGRTSGRKNS